MKLYLLVTDEMKATMPKTINIIANYGKIKVVFPDENNNIEHEMVGDNVSIEATNEDLIKWLKPFDGVAIGTGGSPQFEQFEIMSIKDEL
jgi:thioredoxin reductase